MSITTQEKIKKHFSRYKSEMKKIFERIGITESDMEIILAMVAVGHYNIANLSTIFIEYNDDLTIDDALTAQEDLFSKVFYNISELLEQQHKEFDQEVDTVNKELAAKQLIHNINTTTKSTTVSWIENTYGRFVTQGEVTMLMEHMATKVHDFDATKTDFYNAINTVNQADFITALGILCNSGKLKELFKNDERYMKFWRNRILKEKGLEGVRRFDENPTKLKIFGGFIKYLLEERFGLPKDQAVLWGVLFSSIAHTAGDTNFAHFAYGDLVEKKFKWNF